MSKKRTSTSDGCCPDVAALIEPRFFRALCDPNRIALLVRLARCGKPCTVTEMSACCPVNISVVSRHLALLREAGILDSYKKGKEVYYSVRFGEIVGTLRALADAIDQCCPADAKLGFSCHSGGCAVDCGCGSAVTTGVVGVKRGSSRKKANRKNEHSGKRS